MMIKRAKSGHIEEMVDKDTEVLLPDLNMSWSDVVINDVLDAPGNVPVSIDVDLEEEEEGEIAVKC